MLVGDPEYSFPELPIEDRMYLQRLYNLHGMERVLGWLRGKVAVSLPHQFEDDFDEDEYYRAMAERYIDTDKTRQGES